MAFLSFSTRHHCFIKLDISSIFTFPRLKALLVGCEDSNSKEFDFLATKKSKQSKGVDAMFIG